MKRNCERKYLPQEGEANVYAFVEYLECLADLGHDNEEVEVKARQPDRAALARLRRTRGKYVEEAYEAYQYVVPWAEQARKDWDSEWHEACYYLVAALFAFYQPRSRFRRAEDAREEFNLGASFHELDRQQREENQTDERSPSLERRFTSLLMSRHEDLPERLRQAVALLKAKEIPIDWAQLLKDLRYWGGRESATYTRRPFSSPQRRWAKAFWRITTDEASALTPYATTTTAEN